MSISSYVDITRKEALDCVFKELLSQQEELLRLAVNAMSNSELASRLHSDYYFFHVSGKGQLEEK